ncbi:XdhC family protein [Celeribacter sp.]|uniref:XdhC family protein n=1 Tax=Celeribacter sp. TaxID=1890673 RepID=UPI003A945AD3
MKDITAIRAILERPRGAVLAVIVGVEGPSYRPLGAMMTIYGKNDCVGSLSSGCIEADLALQAQETLREGAPRLVRYGRGSKFIDIQLPCGGGLEIVLLPTPDLAVLTQLDAKAKQRHRCALDIDIESGAMTLGLGGATRRTASGISIDIVPEIRVFAFGKGPEVNTFVALATSAGYPAVVLSPDDETIALAKNLGCVTQKLTSKTFPDDLAVDDRSAIILFFHDHDWEPEILAASLKTPAFYIGAQGSLKARDARFAAMRGMGVSDKDLERMHGPVGLISSVKDPTTLAISVLAEIVGKAMQDSGA